MIISKSTKLHIIIPKDATSRELFAAEELKLFIKKILNCDAEIVDDSLSVSGCKIIIAGPFRNKYAAKYIDKKSFANIVPGPEGIFIKSYDDTIIIAGSNNNSEHEFERGTVYAVYEFLERYLGACFAEYSCADTDNINSVSQIEEVCLTDIYYVKAKADLPYRTAIVQYGDHQSSCDHKLNMSFLNWLVRNRYNRILTWSKVYEGYRENGMLTEAIKRGVLFSVGHHAASKMFLPPYGNEYFSEKYFETHPEFYKLTSEGERFCPEDFWGQWIFCSRNKELVEVISKNIISWIHKNPAVDTIAFWPLDGKAEHCQCQECSKYSKVCNYTYFLNAVAKGVGKECPHIKIDLLAYVDLWEPPENLKLEPNLIIDEATWHHTGLRKGGAPDGSSIIGTIFDDTILKWKALGADVVFYDYYMAIYSARNRLVPIADEIQALSKYYAEKGIKGSGTQIECFNLWNHIFNFYCFGRTLYDTSLSMDDNLERFTRMFGDGGKYVSQIIKILEECVDNEVDVQTIALEMMKKINKEEIYELYDKALDSAKEPYQRNNIRMMRLVFRYTDLETAEFYVNEIKGYQKLQPYIDETGELYHMSQYDSYKHNNPGYGVMIPVDCKEKDTFIPDKWYDFE